MGHYAPTGGAVKRVFPTMGVKPVQPLGVLILLGLVGCQPASRGSANSFHLVEKGTYQALYGPDGHVERIVQDTDGDRRAEAVLLYAPNGKLRQAEIDTDRDGRVDRWEYFDAQGALERVVTANR